MALTLMRLDAVEKRGITTLSSQSCTKGDPAGNGGRFVVPVSVLALADGRPAPLERVARESAMNAFCVNLHAAHVVDDGAVESGWNALAVTNLIRHAADSINAGEVSDPAKLAGDIRRAAGHVADLLEHSVGELELVQRIGARPE